MWKTDAPTEPGLVYWYKAPADGERLVTTERIGLAGELWVKEVGSKWWRWVNTLDGKWYRITPPPSEDSDIGN